VGPAHTPTYTGPPIAVDLFSADSNYVSQIYDAKEMHWFYDRMARMENLLIHLIRV
jgi:hypothetical protein